MLCLNRSKLNVDVGISGIGMPVQASASQRKAVHASASQRKALQGNASQCKAVQQVRDLAWHCLLATLNHKDPIVFFILAIISGT